MVQLSMPPDCPPCEPDAPARAGMLRRLWRWSPIVATALVSAALTFAGSVLGFMAIVMLWHRLPPG